MREDDYEVSDDDLIDDRPRRRVKVRLPRKSLKVGWLNYLLLAATVLCFALVAMAPLLTWFTVSLTDPEDEKNEKPRVRFLANGYGQVEARARDDLRERFEKHPAKDRLDPEGRPDGTAITIVSAALALLTAVGCGLVLGGAVKFQGRTILIPVLIAGMIGALVLVAWHVAWVWTVVGLSEAIREDFRKRFFGDVRVTTSLAPGLFAGLGLSIVAAFSVSKLADLHMSKWWILLVEGIGLLLGVLLILLMKPWDAEDFWEAFRKLIKG